MNELTGVAGAEPRSPATAQRRVLVVDDNVDSSESLAMLLQYSGFAVRTCNDPREVLRSIQAFRPHIGLLDIGLPGISGYDLASAIRQSADRTDNADRAHIVLIATTGYGRPEDKARATAAGFDDFLVKPVDLDKLLQTIDRLTP